MQPVLQCASCAGHSHLSCSFSELHQLATSAEGGRCLPGQPFYLVIFNTMVTNNIVACVCRLQYIAITLRFLSSNTKRGCLPTIVKIFLPLSLSSKCTHHKMIQICSCCHQIFVQFLLLFFIPLVYCIALHWTCPVQMVYTLVKKGANNLWEHQLHDSHSKTKVRKPTPRDRTQ